MYIKSISDFITDTEQVDDHLRGGVVRILTDIIGADNESEMDSWGGHYHSLRIYLENCRMGLSTIMKYVWKSDINPMKGQMW